MKMIHAFTTGGRQLSALHYGPASDRAIVFFHGAGSSGLLWKPDERQLERAGWRMLVPQRPGVGSSERVPGFSVGQVIADTMEFLVQCGIRQTCLLAWSNGAAYAVSFAHCFPDMVQRVGLINPTPPLTDEYAFRLAANWRRNRFMMRFFPGILRWQFRHQAAQIYRQPERFLAHLQRQLTISDQVLLERLHFASILLEDCRQAFLHRGEALFHDLGALVNYSWRLRQLAMPVEIWQGRGDTHGSVHSALSLKEDHPAARLWILPREGYWAGVESLMEWLEILILPKP